MKKRQMVLLMAAAMVAGSIGGALLSPAPVGAVSKEIELLVGNVTQLLQGQRDMQSSLDSKFAVLTTLINQQADSSAKVNASIGALQKTMQDLQANSGASLSSVTTQVQGVADNMGEVQQRLGTINQQITDLKNTLQSLDAKVSTLAQPPAQTVNPATGTGTVPGTTPAQTPGMPTSTLPTTTNPAAGVPTSNSPGGAATGNLPTLPSSEVLYDSALQDWLTGKNDLAQQEFDEYLKDFPSTDKASNAVFYLGEIAFSEKRYPTALDHYSDVLSNFPKSYKRSTALYKRGMTYLALGKRPNAIADFREVVRLFPNSDDEKHARAQLTELRVPISAGR